MSEWSLEPHIVMIKSLEVRARRVGRFDEADYLRQSAETFEKYGELSPRVIRICSGIHDYFGEHYNRKDEEMFE